MSGVAPLGVGIIGVGNIADLYLRNLQKLAPVKLVACAGRREAVAAEKAHAFGIEALRVPDLLRRPDIDIVVNLTPPEAHAAVNQAILEAGKHLYSEKPLCVDYEDARALLDFADRRGLRVACAPDTFLGAGGRLARARIDSGALGRIVLGTCTLMSRGMEHWHPNPNFFYQAGAGPLFDLGPYYVTTLVNLIGPVASVTAAAAKGYAERIVTAPGPTQGRRIPVDTPTSVLALLRFVNGAIVTLTLSWDVWRHDHAPIELYGTEGSIKVPNPDLFDGEVATTERNGPWKGSDSASLAFGDPNWRHAVWSAAQPSRANHRGLGVADLAVAIQTGGTHRASGALAAHVLEVLHAVLRSADDGRSHEIASKAERPDVLSEADAAQFLTRS